MNTKVVIGVVAIIIIAAGAYYLVAKNNSMSGTQMPQTTVQNGPMSLQSLVAAGAPVTCTFSTTTAQGEETGTMYIASGMVAGDFTMSGGTQGTIDAHMIIENQTSYMWTSMSTMGFKSTVIEQATSSSSNQGVNYNSPMDYSCQPWTVDSTKFNLPANISFTAAASYIPPAQGAGATGAGAVTPGGGTTGAPPVKGTAAQCAACNSLPSAQKAQCLAALQC